MIYRTMGSKIYCHPFTIADSKSRFLFTAKGHYKETLKATKTEFSRVFRKFGIPTNTYRQWYLFWLCSGYSTL